MCDLHTRSKDRFQMRDGDNEMDERTVTVQGITGEKVTRWQRGIIGRDHWGVFTLKGVQYAAWLEHEHYGRYCDYMIYGHSGQSPLVRPPNDWGRTLLAEKQAQQID